MAQLYLPGGILSMAAGAAERLIELGSGDAALLYLWLLKTGGAYQSARAARDLHWNESRCDGAFASLIGLGLADKAKSEPSPVPPVREEPPEYSSSDITRELENDASSFPLLVQEVQRRLGKILSDADLKCLYTIHDFIGLPIEVTLLEVSWCIREHERKYGAGRRPRLPQIQKEALRWKERGADTLETAEAYIKRMDLLRDRTAQIMAVLDIRDRPAVAREREYIEGWLNMGFTEEAIRLAYERTVLKKQSLNWAYMNSILRSWHQKGLHTADEISAGDALDRPVKGKSGLGATVPQPVPPGEAAKQTEEDMEWVRQFLKQQNGEAS